MTDQLSVFPFSVEIDGLQDAQFTECSGFEVKLDVEEYKEGGLNDYVHKIPGRQSYSNITLKRGVVKSIALWEWLHDVNTKKAKKDTKKNMSVVLHDTKGSECIRWNLINAYPVKWSTGTLQTDQSNVLIESLELAFQEFTVQKR